MEKYRGKDTRHECPACHTRDSFVLYVDEQGNYISDTVGRCNREDKCGYHLTPSDYFKEKGIDYAPTIHVEKKPLPPTDYIPDNVAVKSLRCGKENQFLQFLIQEFGAKKVSSVLDKFYIGDAKDGRVIFWQVDEQGRTRTGKIMKYDPVTGRRVKNVPGSFDWAHRKVKSDYQLEQCLFGLHQLRKDNAPIYICESEKSAIIASMEIGGVWMATGGKQNFRLLEAVKGLDVTLIPDLGAYDDWKKISEKYGFQCSDMLELIATDEDRKNGLDIADYLINENRRKKYECIKKTVSTAIGA